MADRKTAIFRRRGVHYFFAAMVLSLLHYRSWIFPLDHYGSMDTDVFLAWRLAITDALRQGELLHWMPWLCGGVPGLANPQSGAFSPLNLLAFFLNPVLQMKAALLFNLAGSAAGFFIFARRQKLSLLAALAGFMLWSFNGFIGFRILHGQLTFFPLLLLPLLVALLLPRKEKGESSALFLAKDDLLAVGTTLLILLQDGFQVLIFGFFFLGIVALLFVWKEKSPFPLLRVGGWGLAACLLSAFRIWPMLQLLGRFPRNTESTDFMDGTMLYNAFLDFGQKDLYYSALQAPHSVWGAYGSYLGWTGLLLSLAGLAFFRKHIAVFALLLPVVVGLLLMPGSFSAWAPWNLIHSLPMLDMVRFPNRFASMVLLSLAFLAVFGTVWLTSRFELGRGIRRFLFPLVLLTLFVDLHGSLNPLFAKLVKQRLPATESITRNTPYRAVRGHPLFQYGYISRNQGLCNCYRALELPNFCAPDGGLVLSTEGKGSLARAVLVPNGILLESESDSGTVVWLNQNREPGWRVSEGNGQLLGKGIPALLRVELSSGKQRVQLEYRAPGFNTGLVISLISLVVLSVGILLLRRRRSTLGTLE